MSKYLSDNQAVTLAAPASERDALKTGDVLPVAPLRFGHFPRTALVSRPGLADHAQQSSGLGLGQPQALSGGGYFLGGRHGLILGRIRWLRKTLDTSVSVGYTCLNLTEAP